MNTQDHSAQLTHRIRSITWAGLLINVGLSVVKMTAGLFGHSQALVADSIHSLSDTVTDVAMLVGARHWTAPPDRSHPYGHGRIETLLTLFIGASLGSAGIGLGWHALSSIRTSHDPIPPDAIALIGALLSVFCKEWLYRWTIREGNLIHSKAVIANAWHHRSDALSSLPVAAAVLIAMVYPQWNFVDHIGAIVVSVFIVVAAVRILYESFYELADAGVPEEITAHVHDLAVSHANVREVHAVRARRVGALLQVDMHILVDGTMPVSRGHAISEEVCDRLLASDLGIGDVVVHLEPYPQSRKGIHVDD